MPCIIMIVVGAVVMVQLLLVEEGTGWQTVGQCSPQYKQCATTVRCKGGGAVLQR
jgi:hypothetical protein